MFNVALIAGLWAMILAQWMKVPIYYYKTGAWDWNIVLSTGSMPSSHSAFVVSASTAIGFLSGFDSTIFALAAVFSLITIHDAIKVRGESGKQAAVVNDLVADLQLVYESLNLKNSSAMRDTKLKELIGHTTAEVVGGIVLGIATAIVFLVINSYI